MQCQQSLIFWYTIWILSYKDHCKIVIFSHKMNALFIYLFIWQRLRERESERGNTSRGSGRGRSRLPTEQGAWCRAQSQDPGIMTQAEGRGFNTLSHPGAPIYLFDRERERQQQREYKQGEWERKKQASYRAGSLIWGSIPGAWDHDPSRRQRPND